MFDMAIERRCQRPPMNGIGEEEAPTAPIEAVPLEWVLRNPLVGEGGFRRRLCKNQKCI